MITFENGVFTLENKLFRRQLKLDGQGIRSFSFRNLSRDLEYAVCDGPPEFSCWINGTAIRGNTGETQNLKYRTYEIGKIGFGGESLKIIFDLPEGMGSLALISLIYPDLPGTVRKMEFTAGEKELKLSDLVLETFNLAPGNRSGLQVFREQGQLPALNEFTVTGTDDLLRFHDAKLQAGFYTGSSIPGPLRYVMYYPHWISGARYGYSQSTPVFRKYIAPGESWCSDEVYLLFYSGSLEDCRGRNDFRELVRRSLPPLTPVAGPMYCTWIPFLKNVSETLVAELAAKAKEAGFDILVLDDGWFTMDAWQVDKEKFPNGLEEVARILREAGVKFGLWFNIGTDYGNPGSEAADNCTLPDGSPKNGGKPGIRCFASAHRERIAEKLKSLAEQYGLAYFKMDFSNIISPYGVLPVGCASHDHAYHREYEDSVAEQYRSLYALRENMKSFDPDLCLDYSFEVFGTEFPGVAGLRYSDVQHVSNFNMRKGVCSPRIIRQGIYAFTGMLPPERVSGSLIELQGECALENLYTSLVGNPLMAGDLRTLTPEQLRSSARIFGKFKALSAKGPLTDRQLWQWHRDREDPDARADGYFRWSRESGEGMAVIFANDSGAESVTAAFQLPDDAPRRLRDMDDGCDLGVFTAQALRQGVELPFAGKRVRGFAVEKASV